jgi:DNA-directed RNA polymerase subunit L
MAFQDVMESDDGTHISFKIKDVPMSVANGIRRSCLVEVPMAGIDIDTVSFDPDKNGVNTSSMHDEMLIHRLAYALLDVDPKAAGEYSFHICDPQDKDVPFENKTQGIIDFTTSDISVFRNGADTRIPSEDVFLGDSLLTRLKPGQKLRATFGATYRAVRQGNDVRYSFQPCRVKFSHAEATKTSTPPRTFALEVTTHGFNHIKAREIVTRAIDVLRSKVKWLTTSDPEAKPDSVLPNCSVFTVLGEDHTLGRMLVETLEQIKGVTFVAYMKTHALDSDMRLKVATGHDGRQTLLEACEILSTLLDGIAQQWVAV